MKKINKVVIPAAPYHSCRQNGLPQPHIGCGAQQPVIACTSVTGQAVFGLFQMFDLMKGDLYV